MKQFSLLRTNLLLVVFSIFAQATSWAQTGTDVWEAGTIGSSKIPGTGTVAGTGPGAIYSVSGQGYIFATSDSGYFYYHQLSGDGTLVARLVSQTGTSPSSKMGVMIRPSVDGRDANIFVCSTPSGAVCQYRAVMSDKTSHTEAPGGLPLWVKVERQGNLVAGYTSADGTTWTQLGPTVTVTWPDATLIGFAVASNSADLSNATIDNVTLTPGTPTTPPDPAVAPAPSTNAATGTP